MPDQADRPDKERPTPPAEARYKYMADFSRKEHSPNLRKEYEEQYEKLSNRSHEYPRSRRRYEPYRLRHSPPCSTFNPRKEQSLQFSPYENCLQNIQDQLLAKQLLEENCVLKMKLEESQDGVEWLRAELVGKSSEITRLREKSQVDSVYYECIVRQMKAEFQITLNKNKLLEDELFVVHARIREDNGRRLSIPLRERTMPYCPPENNRAKRSVGKLLNKSTTHTHAHSQQHSRQNSMIKIEDENEGEGEDEKEVTRGAAIQVVNEKENKNKNQELIAGIRTMHAKISGEETKSLKELWKWLKGLGHGYSCLKKWKRKVSKAGEGPATLDKLKEIIHEACTYID